MALIPPPIDVPRCDDHDLEPRLELGRLVLQCSTCGITYGEPADYIRRHVCEHRMAEHRRFEHSNGTLHACWQCLQCGKKITNGISKNKLKNAGAIVDLLPEVVPEEKFDSYLLKMLPPVVGERVDQDEFLARAIRAWREKKAEYMQSAEWQQKRQLVIERADGKCEKCGAPGRDVHHLTYERTGDELLEDLLYLCRRCHMEEHGDMHGL